MLMRCTKTCAVVAAALLLLNAIEFSGSMVLASPLSSHGGSSHASGGARTSGGVRSSGGARHVITRPPANSTLKHGSNPGRSSSFGPHPTQHPTWHPVVPPNSSIVRQPTPAHLYYQHLDSGRGNGAAALRTELQARAARAAEERLRLHNSALQQYLSAIDALKQSRAYFNGRIEPSIDIPMAEGHLAAARELALIGGRNDEVKWHVASARTSLESIALKRPQDVPYAWRWRMHYLMGDVCLFENDPAHALYYYQQTVDETTDFTPAEAMVQYLTDAGGGTATPVQSVTDAPNTGRIQDSSSPPDQVNSSSQPFQPTASESGQTAADHQQQVAAMTAQLKQDHPAQKVFYPSPDIVQIAGTFLGIVAELFEITELAPVAGIITLGGMIADHLSKEQN